MRLTSQRCPWCTEFHEESQPCVAQAEVEQLRALLEECVEIGNALAGNDGGRREWLDLRFRIRAKLGKE